MELNLEISIDGERSATLSSRWQTLIVTDGVGHEGDAAVLTLSVARALEVEMPRLGTDISFAVGRSGRQAEALGEALKTVAIAGDTREGTLTIESEAVAPSSPLREQRDASWTGQSIGDIVGAIAERAGLVPAVSAMLSEVVPDGAIQVAESDRQFLHRLLNRLDGRALVKGGRLIVLAAGERTAASGATLPPLTIDLEDGSWVRWRRTDPGVRGTVSARYYAPDGSTIRTVTVGSGLPRRRLPGVFYEAGTATRSAERNLLKSASSRDSIEIERQLTLSARALYPLQLTHGPHGFPTQLTIQEVRHTLGQQVARTLIRARP